MSEVVQFPTRHVPDAKLPGDRCESQQMPAVFGNMLSIVMSAYRMMRTMEERSMVRDQVQHVMDLVDRDYSHEFR